MQIEVYFSQIVVAEEVVKKADGTVSTFAYVHPLIYEVIDLYGNKDFSSLKLISLIEPTCRGIASQQIPNSPHFLGVKKYTGPGCWGSQG